MGGKDDGDGFIDAEKLIRIIKEEFEMTIDIEKLIQDIDEDGSGEIEYDEFRNLLSSSDWIQTLHFETAFISLMCQLTLLHRTRERLCKLICYLYKWFDLNSD